jgi:hypothetical protein
MTNAPPPPPFEQQKWFQEMKREDAYRASDWLVSRQNMLDQAAIKSGDAALRAGLLINGGAAISVLAFMGSLAAKDMVPISHLSRVADSLVVFAWGVVAAVVGLGLSYLTHLSEGRARLDGTSPAPWEEPARGESRARGHNQNRGL